MRAGLPARMGPDWHLAVLTTPDRHPLAALAAAVATLTDSDAARTP